MVNEERAMDKQNGIEVEDMDKEAEKFLEAHKSERYNERQATR